MMSPMTDVLDLHATAMGRFDELVRAIRRPHWENPTPCTDWTVRDLLNHLVVEQLWAPQLIGGASIAEVGDRFDGDQLGDAPLVAWQDASRAAFDAFHAPGALEHEVELSYTRRSARDYCGEMTFDLTVHAWDLARGIGADAGLDPALVLFSYDLIAPQMELVAGSGLFDPPVDIPDDAAPQARLLAITGRRP